MAVPKSQERGAEEAQATMTIPFSISINSNLGYLVFPESNSIVYLTFRRENLQDDAAWARMLLDPSTEFMMQRRELTQSDKVLIISEILSQIPSFCPVALEYEGNHYLVLAQRDENRVPVWDNARVFRFDENGRPVELTEFSDERRLSIEAAKSEYAADSEFYDRNLPKLPP